VWPKEEGKGEGMKGKEGTFGERRRSDRVGGFVRERGEHWMWRKFRCFKKGLKI